MITKSTIRAATLSATGLAFGGCIAAFFLAACSSGTTPAGQPSAAPVASDSPAAPAEPDTAAGAQAAAQTIYELYGGGQYAAVYADMVPDFRAAVPEATYVGVHDACPSTGLSYKITDPVLSDPATAVVTVSLAGAASSLGSESEVFSYVNGKWLWNPSAQIRAPYSAGTVNAIVQKLKAEGECQ